MFFQDEDGNMPTSLVATALRALGQSPTEMEIHEIVIKVNFINTNKFFY